MSKNSPIFNFDGSSKIQMNMRENEEEYRYVQNGISGLKSSDMDQYKHWKQKYKE